jgi:CheY-like chemotaxis protein
MAVPSAKKVVLVADDDTSILRVVAMVLATKGIKTITAEDGEQAVERASKQMPDAILLDIRMPKLDGFQVFEKLRADPVTAHIPVAFFTADKDFGDFRKAQEMGGLIYISNPSSPTRWWTRCRCCWPPTAAGVPPTSSTVPTCAAKGQGRRSNPATATRLGISAPRVGTALAPRGYCLTSARIWGMMRRMLKRQIVPRRLAS